MKKKNIYFFLLLMLTGAVTDTKTEKSSDHTLNSIFKKQVQKMTLVKVTDTMYAWNTEVSNLMYRVFLEELKKKGDMEKYNLCNIDSMKWRDNRNYNEPFSKYYHIHPAYNNYPVVNVSYVGATIFCEWLTEKYNSYPKRKFKKVKFRLPEEEEWIYAAKGGLDSIVFPWEYPSPRNFKGEYLCNFHRINEACLKQDRVTGEIKLDCSSAWVRYLPSLDWGADITAPVYSYWPNGYGLYNVCGNVAEMLLEKGRTKGGSWLSSGYYVRIDAEDEYKGFTEPSPMIGFRFFMEVVEK